MFTAEDLRHAIAQGETQPFPLDDADPVAVLRMLHEAASVAMESLPEDHRPTAARDALMTMFAMGVHIGIALKAGPREDGS